MTTHKSTAGKHNMPEAVINSRRRFLRNAAVAIAAPKLCGVAVIASGAGDEGGMPELNGAMAWLNSPPIEQQGVARESPAG